MAVSIRNHICLFFVSDKGHEVAAHNPKTADFKLPTNAQTDFNFLIHVLHLVSTILS